MAILRLLRSSRSTFLTLSLLGCQGEGSLDPEMERQAQTLLIERQASDALAQTLRLTPAQPAPGDTLRIESVVVNGGTSSATVSVRICGLDLETNLRFGPYAGCDGYSMRGTLAPGDSITERVQRVIASGPGDYPLRIRHLLDPEQWIDLQLRVRN